MVRFVTIISVLRALNNEPKMIYGWRELLLALLDCLPPDFPMDWHRCLEEFRKRVYQFSFNHLLHGLLEHLQKKSSEICKKMATLSQDSPEFRSLEAETAKIRQYIREHPATKAQQVFNPFRNVLKSKHLNFGPVTPKMILSAFLVKLDETRRAPNTNTRIDPDLITSYLEFKRTPSFLAMAFDADLELPEEFANKWNARVQPAGAVTEYEFGEMPAEAADNVLFNGPASLPNASDPVNLNDNHDDKMPSVSYQEGLLEQFERELTRCCVNVDNSYARYQADVRKKAEIEAKIIRKKELIDKIKQNESLTSVVNSVINTNNIKAEYFKKILPKLVKLKVVGEMLKSAELEETEVILFQENDTTQQPLQKNNEPSTSKKISLKEYYKKKGVKKTTLGETSAKNNVPLPENLPSTSQGISVQKGVVVREKELQLGGPPSTSEKISAQEHQKRKGAQKRKAEVAAEEEQNGVSSSENGPSTSKKVSVFENQKRKRTENKVSVAVAKHRSEKSSKPRSKTLRILGNNMTKKKSKRQRLGGDVPETQETLSDVEQIQQPYSNAELLTVPQESCKINPPQSGPVLSENDEDSDGNGHDQNRLAVESLQDADTIEGYDPTRPGLTAVQAEDSNSGSELDFLSQNTPAKELAMRERLEEDRLATNTIVDMMGPNREVGVTFEDLLRNTTFTEEDNSDERYLSSSTQFFDE